MAIIIENCTENKKNLKKTVERWKRKSFGTDYRDSTDKYWIILFFIVLLIWMFSGNVARHKQKPGDTNVNVNNETLKKNVTELVPYFLWGKSSTFDAITCNVAFINEHYENSGSIVIITNVLYCIFLTIYSLWSMRTDIMFYGELNVACKFFIVIAVYFRLIYYFKIKFWPIPEAIFILIWYIKKLHVDKELNRLFNNEMRIFHRFNFPVLITFIPVILLILLGLYALTTRVVSELAWDNLQLYIIIFGACYLGLTLLNFWSMIISSAVDISADTDYQDIQEGFSKIVDRTLEMVKWCHFGTACYHATLIFPRLESMKVMNEPEFKKIPRYEKCIDRFYVTHCKLHNLTLMCTAVSGTNHSESLRELLRHYATDLTPRLQYFQGFSQITRSTMALLLSLNALTMIFLWSYDLHDPRISSSSWSYYLSLIIGLSIPMKICDIVMDTILLHSRYEPFPYAHFITHLSQVENENYET